MLIEEKSLSEISREVDFSKCVLVEGEAEKIVEEGEWFEIDVKLMFDKDILKINALNCDSIFGVNLNRNEYKKIRMRLGYFDNQVVKILQNIISKMRFNETSQISFELDPDLLDETFQHRYRTSKQKREKIYLDLKFEINLSKIEKHDSCSIDQSKIYKLNFEQLIELSNEHKKDANDLYKKNLILTAFQRYHKAISYAIIAEQLVKEKRKILEEKQYLEEIIEEENHDTNSKNLNTIKQIKAQLYANLAACQLKSNENDMAIINCTKCLDLENNNVKALFRRAQCYTVKNDYELALEDFKLAAQLDPDNNEIKKKLTQVENLKKQYQQKLSSNLKKMFE